jgi:hypothetical protein
MLTLLSGLGLRPIGGAALRAPDGRGLHSSTFWLNLSTFGSVRWVVSVTKRLRLSRYMDA